MEPVTTAEPMELRDYIRVVRARKWTILLVTVLVLGLALAYSYSKPPIYIASARLLVGASGGLVTAGGLTVASAANEAEVIESIPVAKVVVQRDGLDLRAEQVLGGVSATPVSERSQVIVVSYSSSDPALSEKLANSFAYGYLRYRENQARAHLERRISGIEQRIQDAVDRLAIIREEFRAARAVNDTAQLSILASERALLDTQLQALQQTLTQVQTSGPAIEAGEVLEAARRPAAPVSPNHRMDGMLGLMLGLLLGVGGAFLRESLDHRFQGRMEVGRSLGAPVLATIPHVARSKRKKGLVLLSDPNGMASETFRRLRTNVEFAAEQRSIKSFLVTSSVTGEGKTFTSANLALALAQSGRRVILVSADLRRPAFERMFGLSGRAGFATWLIAKVEHFRPPLIPHPDMPNLEVLLSGSSRDTNPAQLLASPRLPQIMEELEGRADYVVLDSPPVLPVADGIILAEHVDATILVVNPDRAQKEAALHAREMLDGVNATVIGVVVNNVDAKSSHHEYPYDYLHYKPVKASSNGRRPRWPRRRDRGLAASTPIARVSDRR